MAKKVKIYTSPTCQYCEMAKEYFKENNIKYEELSVEEQKNAQEAVEKSSGTAVPVIDIEGKIIIGFDQEKIDEALKE
jgi:glutaredoxin-like YruB-family protein